MPDLQAALVAAVHRTQSMPYAWPAAPDAASTRLAGVGTCAGKHAVLREDLEAFSLPTQRVLVIGPLVPSIWPDLQERAGDLWEVHECVTVETPWAGPLLLDVTWHPGAIRAGLSGTLAWDGFDDMKCAVEPVSCYALADARFREQKQLLRARLYGPAQRALRDEVLAQMAARAAVL
jgi:hypothetical protein